MRSPRAARSRDQITYERTLERLRRICLALPETSEVVAWGHPNFRAGRKIFAVLEVYKGVLSIAVKAALPDQEALLHDPRFDKTPYIGQSGWVSLKVGGRLHWDPIRPLVLASYRLVALKRMVAALDDATGGR